VEKGNPPYILFMLLISLLALAALAVEAVFPLDAGTRQILNYADTIVCVLFFADFLVLFYRAENRWRYLLTWGWLDLISSIPMIDVLRWGRVARLMRIFRVLRGVRSARILTRFILERRAQSALFAAALVSIILVAVSSISVLHFEASADSNIKTPEDALWWAIVTMTTVGYGDKFPITSEGRIVAAVLMAAGVGLFATFSGLVAAWFLAPAQATRESEFAELKHEIAELKKLLTGNGPTNAA